MIQIFDGDGTIAWSGPDGESPSHHLAAMRTLLGDIVDGGVQRSDVLRKAEELEFVSRKGGTARISHYSAARHCAAI
jgi:hypothetical protein